jgi:hypothetical protein
MVLQFEGGARGVITSCTSCRRSRSGAGLESFEGEERESDRYESDWRYGLVAACRWR